jgi:hypothetical protein
VSSADVVVSVVGAALIGIFAFMFWLLQRSIEKRGQRLDSLEAKVDALVGTKEAVQEVAIQVTAIAHNFNEHLIQASADHARLTDHLQYHRI